MRTNSAGTWMLQNVHDHDLEDLEADDSDLLERPLSSYGARDYLDDYGRQAGVAEIEAPVETPRDPGKRTRTILNMAEVMRLAQARQTDEQLLRDPREMPEALGASPDFPAADAAAGGRRQATADFVTWLAGRPAGRVADVLAILLTAHEKDVEYQVAIVEKLVQSGKLFRVLDRAAPSPQLWRAVLLARRAGLFRAKPSKPGGKARPAAAKPAASAPSADVERLHEQARRVDADVARVRAAARWIGDTRPEDVVRTAGRAALSLVQGTAVARAGTRAIGIADELSGGLASRWASRAQGWLAGKPAMARAEAAPPSESMRKTELEQLDQSGGLPLPPRVQAAMSELFGHDFSHVRVHLGPSAEVAADSIGASAVTIGSHIFFGAGRFAPGTPAGDKLLIHELTHVAQHDQGRLPRSDSGRVQVSSPSDHAEQEARAMESRAPQVQARTQAQPDARAPQADRPAAGRAEQQPSAAQGKEPSKGDKASPNLVTDAAASIVRRVSPGLADLIEQGPVGLFKRTVEPAIKSWVGSVTSGITVGDVITNLQSSMTAAFGVLQGAKGGDAKCCETLVNGINAIREVAQAFINNPVFQAIKNAFGKVNAAISKVAKFVLEPVFDVLKTIAGGVWDAVTGLARTIWGWVKAVKDVASSAFDWVATQLGFTGVSGEGGILDWLKDKAKSVWDSIKAAIKPIQGPLTAVIAGLGMMTGLTQIYLIVKYGPKVVEAIQWLWAHRSDPNIVKSAHKEMGNTILPKVLEGVQGFSGVVKGAVSGFLGELKGFGEKVLSLLGAITGIPLLGMAKSFIQNISDGVQSAVTWVGGALKDAGTWIADVAKKIGAFIAPYKEVLCSLAMAIVNPTMIPMILAGWAWRWLPDCIKPPIIDLLLDALIAFVQALPNFIMFGPLWPLLKSGVVGFMQGLRGKSPAEKIKVSNKVAKLISGASPEFLLGFVKGFLGGIWDGIKDPIELIWMLAKGLVWVIDYLGALATDAGKTATASKAPAAPPRPAAPPPAPATDTASKPPGATTTSGNPPSTGTVPSGVGVPSTITMENIAGIVSGVATTLVKNKPKAPPNVAAGSTPPVHAPAGTVTASTTPAAPTTPAPAGGNNAGEWAEIGVAAAGMAGELRGPVAIFQENFMPAVQELFQGGDMSFDQFLAKMGDIWDSALGMANSAGQKLAGMVTNFMMQDSAEGALGEAIGYVVGMIAFELVLDYFTAGTYTGAMKIVQMIAKFLNWPSKAFGEALKLIGKLGGLLISGVKKLGQLAAKASGGALKAVVKAIQEIGEKLMKFADNMFGKAGKLADDAAGGAGGKVDDVAGGVGGKVDDAAGTAGGKVDDAAGTAGNKADNAGNKADDAGKKADDGKGKVGDDAARKEAMKAAEIAEATAVVQMIKNAAQVGHVPAVLLAGALGALKWRYEWIDRFEADKGAGSNWTIYMIASKHSMGAYRDDTDGKRPVPEGGLTVDEALAKGIDPPPHVKANPNEFYYDPDNKVFISRSDPLPAGATTGVKGEWGEARMDELMDGKGYKKLGSSQQPMIDEATGLPVGDGRVQGIDGVYENLTPPPKYMIAEAKFNTSKYGNTVSSGKQMSDKWIIDRLEQVVGPEKAAEIMAEGYGRMGVRVMPNGTMIVEQVTW